MIRRLATLPFACALLLTSAVALARAPVVPPTALELRAIVETLTAPAMDGRRAGTPGGDRATEQLAAWLGAAGLRPAGDSGTFLQSFRVAPGRRLGPRSALEIGGRALTPGVDWTPHGGSRPGEITGPLAFVDDEWSGDVRGKIVVATSRRSRLETLILARQRGAAAVLLVADPLPTLETTSAPVDIASGSLTRAAADALRAASNPATARLVVDLACRRRIRGGAKRVGGGAREAAGGDIHRRRGRLECGQRIGDEEDGRRAALACEDQRLEPGATRGRDDDLATHVTAPLVVDERERARDLAGARAAVRRPVHAGRERASADLQRAARAQTPARRHPE